MNITDNFRSKLGHILIKKSKIQVIPRRLKVLAITISNARGKSKSALENMLKEKNKKCWLEIGTGGRRDTNFDYIDIIDFPDCRLPIKYKKFDIVNCTDGLYKTIR